MKHIYQQGTNAAAPVLVLLHGTGGTERDLLPLAGRIDPTASVLSIRGNVLENGLSRYFRRLAEGVFDEEDLVFRTKELHDFLDQAAVDYGFDRENLVAIGYSNGANIAGSLMFHYKDAFRGAILHHPMVPLRSVELPDMTGISCFIGAGRNDQMCPPQETEELQAMLSGAGAAVSVHWENYGHQLTGSEVDAAAAWYAEVICP
ncbi:phospholipase/carboxylesterase [Paenibacillus algorifonticola]|uniref:Phospholipase/carboxylesterase n=1 Tax=Paenibacillus algorifonticola TaxID=684063 RepID=A0A1I2ILX0_9BACL|nr:alpha/beta hydrolase [Paenibacillus algorifonticola]SFF41531.1 phospholipase/carboxylesterase [Paenibacillus algorifonticola]